MLLQYHLGQNFAAITAYHVIAFSSRGNYSSLGIVLANSFDDMFAYV
jgi:hypothetical protein